MNGQEEVDGFESAFGGVGVSESEGAFDCAALDGTDFGDAEVQFW